jgi:hypothetical protein
MKLMLPLPPYHIIYLIVKLSQINLMFIRFQDCSVSIGPFIDTPSTASRISIILVTHQILEQDQCFVEHDKFWCLFLPPTLQRFFTPNYATKVLKLWLSTFCWRKELTQPLFTNIVFQKKKTTPHTTMFIHYSLF